MTKAIFDKYDIIEALKALKDSLVSREFIDPEVTFEMSTKDWKPCRIELHYKVRSDSAYTYKTIYADEPNATDDVFGEAEAYISTLKSKAELEHEEFMLMLGRVMDRAKDMGVDEHFINPLTDMMKRLATNAIEHLK